MIITNNTRYMVVDTDTETAMTGLKSRHEAERAMEMMKAEGRKLIITEYMADEFEMN